MYPSSQLMFMGSWVFWMSPACVSFECPHYNMTLIHLIFPGGSSHQRGWAAVPDLAMGQICDEGGEMCHLWLGSLGSSSALHCNWIFFFIFQECNEIISSSVSLTLFVFDFSLCYLSYSGLLWVLTVQIWKSALLKGKRWGHLAVRNITFTHMIAFWFIFDI